MAESSSRPTASMSSLVVRNPDEHAWDSHRQVLEEKYAKDDWPLHKVMTYMEENHGFVAKKNQYEKYLVHKWRLRKNADAATWKATLPVIRRLQRAGQPFELLFEGKKISVSTIQKELSRYAAFGDVGQSPISRCELPSGVVIRKLNPSNAPSSTVELPFSCLGQYLSMQYPSISLWTQMDANSCMSGGNFGSLATVGLDCSTRQAWDAVMLNKSATNRPFNSPVLTPLYMRFLFSFANNFAGIGALPKEAIFGYLQRETSGDLYRILRSAPEYYTARAIARSLFQASIEVGNAQIVDFLLCESFPDVQANSVIRSHNGLYYAPIERAAALMHTKVVKVLLKHGAQVNVSRPVLFLSHDLAGFTFGSGNSSKVNLPWQGRAHHQAYGALNCLVRGLSVSQAAEVDQIDPELFFMLLNAGGKMDDSTLRHVIENDRKWRFVPLIFSKRISESQRRWNKAGIFLEVFRYHQSQTSSEILRLMLANNVDLNYNVEWKHIYLWKYRRERDYRPGTLIDEVAFRGDLVMVEKLLGYGARLTIDTLPCAIKSGNEYLVERLLTFGTRADSRGWSDQLTLTSISSALNHKIIELVVGQRGSGFLKTPTHLQTLIKLSVLNLKLTDAIVGQQCLRFLKNPRHLEEIVEASIQNPKIMDLVVGQQGWVSLEDPEYLQVATKVASTIGDISWIEYLVKNGGVLDPGDLGLGLTKAVIDGKTDVALALLDAGADTECWHSFRTSQEGSCDGPPLAQALLRGNARLVFALLDAGADPNCHLKYAISQAPKTSLELAVKCGDPAVVRAVIEAGAKLDRDRLALTTAISSRNKDLAIMLLHAGYDVNHSTIINFDETALAAAVRTGDLDWVHFILEWGADPHDPIALHLAWKQNAAAFDLILERHALHYPKGRKGWGAAILKAAIDRDDLKSFQQILKRGADANHQLSSEIQGMEYDAESQRQINLETSLFGYAIAESNNTRIKFVELLLQKQQISGCAPETVVSSDWRMRYTAFLAAIETGDLPTIELLLKHGANVNYSVRNSIRRTPLQKAAEIGNMDVINLLLKRGADPDGRAAHKAGGTALQLASIGGYLRIVQLLLNEGADVNAPPSKIEGRTPLEGAAEHGRLDMVAFLLKAGAGQNSNDKKEFDRAIGRAKENGFPYIADLLKQYLATGKVSASRPLFDEFVNYDMLE